ncbi:hypothetical protein [Kingella potus]|uniref:hypothetical protein n=1 Tax=Kingella potus TaxID=265175 RepID=UPI001FD59873|nr:hypothetical protein [Kingella potus]UOP00353.1 hypothetical protein LVJ84_10700 [Kingella potus]
MDDLETLRRKLDEIYLPLEQEGINGMRLLPQQNAGMGAAEAERLLNVRFPKQFAEIISGTTSAILKPTTSVSAVAATICASLPHGTAPTNGAANGGRAQTAPKT